MKKFFAGLLLVVSLNVSAGDNLAEFYQETAYLSKANTVVNLSKLRFGKSYSGENFRREYYFLTRLLADSRTLLETAPNIYNDNSVFLGPGFDLLGLLPGLRLTASFGYSQDLSSKIDNSTWDYQVGTISYHEKLLSSDGVFFDEWYSEVLFQERYKNTFLNIQNRWRLGEYGLKGLVLRPRLNFVFAWDAKGATASRYFDTRFALRWMFNFGNFVQINVDPQVLRRTALENNYRSYNEFRLLLWAYKEF